MGYEMSKYTPMRIVDDRRSQLNIELSGGGTVAFGDTEMNGGIDKDVAEFIVRACNDYKKDKKLIEGLVEALKKIEVHEVNDRTDAYSMQEIAEEALAKAKKKAELESR